MSSSRFFWLSLLQWGIALVIVTALITEWVFPSSFGVLPSFSLWKLAFNGAVLIGWLVSFGYALRKIKENGSFSFQPVSSRRAFLTTLAAYIGMVFLLMLNVLTDGKPLDTAISFGLFWGTVISIVPISITFFRWIRHRGAK